MSSLLWLQPKTKTSVDVKKKKKREMETYIDKTAAKLMADSGHILEIQRTLNRLDLIMVQRLRWSEEGKLV